MRTLPLALAGCLAVVGCAAPPGQDTTEVTVLAAASLTDAFTALGEDFEREHPGTAVRYSFAGSHQLATQLLEGAPGDVFASADTTQMDRLVEAGLLRDEPAAFARNTLAIAVEPGNPNGVDGLADLTDPGLAVVLAAPEVPAGRYAARALDAAGVSVAPVSLETDVRAVLSRVALGEADAGIVYASDAAAAGDRVDLVRIPAERNVVAELPIAVLDAARDTSAAEAFVAFVRSPAGQERLVEHGFEVQP